MFMSDPFKSREVCDSIKPKGQTADRVYTAYMAPRSRKERCKTRVFVSQGQTGRMLLACVLLLILMAPGCMSGGRDETKFTLSCPEHQKAFRGSCFELVDLQLTFSDAQNWCEQRDGQLAFIPDQETQSFLQRHLDPEKDVWFGAASTISTNLEHSAASEGETSKNGRDEVENCLSI